MFLYVTQSALQSQKIPLSKKQHGFSFGNSCSSVKVDIFIDLACSDSRAAWPAFLQTMMSHSNKIAFTIHLFPLPYHYNAFLAAKAVVATWTKFGIEAGLQAINSIFDSQNLILISEDNEKKSYTYFLELIGQLIRKSTPDFKREDYLEAMVDRSIEMNTRYIWKYSAIKGVFGAPMFFINDIEATSLNSASSSEDWDQILDELLSEEMEHIKQALVTTELETEGLQTTEKYA